MTNNDDCCGWASWGELAGMGDGRVSVDSWERKEVTPPGVERERARAKDASRTGAATPGIVTGRCTGRRARAQLALSRWRLAERNKRG
jgi:hypothetical protein